MKVYDCFTFFNELDVLEIRLKELYNVVDRFVIAEADVTHSGNKKEYILEQNIERYRDYTDKILYLKVTGMPNNGSWARENYQRDCLTNGVQDAGSDDIIIVSDIDEIPRAKAIEYIKKDSVTDCRYLLSHPIFYYKFNYIKISHLDQANIMVSRKKLFQNAQRERELSLSWNGGIRGKCTNMIHAGWHFSYLGDSINAVNKLKSFAHTEENVPEVANNYNIDFLIENKYGPNALKVPLAERKVEFEHVQIDDYFPECIRNNLHKWNKNIIPNAQKRISEIYNIKL